MTRRALTLLAGTLLWATGCQTPPAETAATSDGRAETVSLAAELPVRPDSNVIVISFDALRADALGLYGFDRPTSPNLDAFAERSLVFDRAYSGAPVTPTSFAAAFTGRSPVRTFRAWQLITEETLATAFAAAGYRTVGMFNNIQVTAERHFDLGFDEYRLYESTQDTEMLDGVITWLTEHRDEKIFGWFHFIDPHSPYVRRDASEHLYAPGYEGPFAETTKGKFEADEPADIDRIRQLYDGDILAADAIFGRLIATLEELGLLADSIVIVTADHGEEFLERGVFQHRHLNDETTRLPFLLYHPDRAASGRTSVPVSNLDLLPTLTELVGIAGPAGAVDGASWLGPLSADRGIPSMAMTDGEYRAASLTAGSERLIVHCFPKRSRQLFDLTADPDEQHDVSGERSERMLQLYERLEGRFGEDPCRAIQRAVRGADPAEGLAPETIRELEALGYL